MSIFVLWGFRACSYPSESPIDQVTIDFDMVDTGIDWLELIHSGPPEEQLKTAFMERIVPTQGCQAIIHHWAR